ncbi:acetyl-CoA carboxylase biotin carboxylase subunit family protein [Microbacterium sp. NPDC090007]|uniref:ATP-grasp domain-containing protein n=1 Tax=Microbacterium sp. NPDC090007 TaxID=3364204 RepID=UPI0037FC05CF
MLFFVEAATTGAGLTLLAALHDAGRDVAFVTNLPDRYATSPGSHVIAELSARGRLHVADTTSWSVPSWLPSPARSHGVISSSDKYLPYTAHLAQALGAPFLSVQAVARLRDKRRARELFDELNVGHVRWASPRSVAEAKEFAETVGGPVIIKNVAGSGSMDVAFAQTAATAAAAWEEMSSRPRWLDGDLMMEEFVAGPLVSMETLVTEGRPIFLGVTDRQLTAPPVMAEVGYTFPTEVTAAHRDAMQHAVREIVRALDIPQGFLHTEFILRPGTSHLVEVNARLPGGFFVPMLRDCLNGDLYEMLHDSAVGLPIAAPALNGKFSSGYVSYAPMRGRALESSRVDEARAYPWLVDMVGGVHAGAILAPAADFRGSVAHVRALAPTPSLSATAARAAAESLIPPLLAVGDV